MCAFNNCDMWCLGSKIHADKINNMKFLKNNGPFYTKYHYTQFPVKADEISEFGANQTYAFGTHRCHVTIDQYIFCKYRITLRYPNLPCIVMFGGNGHRSYYPLELLYIVEEQREIKNIEEQIECLSINECQ